MSKWPFVRRLFVPVAFLLRWPFVRRWHFWWHFVRWLFAPVAFCSGFTERHLPSLITQYYLPAGVTGKMNAPLPTTGRPILDRFTNHEVIEKDKVDTMVVNMPMVYLIGDRVSSLVSSFANLKVSVHSKSLTLQPLFKQMGLESVSEDSEWQWWVANKRSNLYTATWPRVEPTTSW